MEATKTVVTVEATVNAPIEKVWDCWTKPEHITQWCQASDDWHAPSAENDLKEGGKYSTRMEAKDGSFGFDFWGIYDSVNPLESLKSTMGDGRKWNVYFTLQGNTTFVSENFEAESENSPEMQQQGWQAILNNFKKYVESK